jgi:uncharacterized membrane protein YdbT with pleckstrin-like domain
MSYIDRNLASGETVLHRTRLHWIVMVKHFIAALALMSAGGVLLFYSFSPTNDKGGPSGTLTVAGVFLFVLAAVLVVLAFWKRSATEMAVTNKRVLVKVGLVGYRSTEIMLSKIESVGVDQSLIGRMLSFGSIVVRGVGGTPEPFAKIAHPLAFRRHVQEQIDKLPEGRTATTTN